MKRTLTLIQLDGKLIILEDILITLAGKFLQCYIGAYIHHIR
jgi:hypothetical protein